ncbi:PIR Superfamily Protein [Plasmodium malariae]|uniref:PIR Superfamily Protein n=1 Tax=Plasmodium malariae TaxID=5858 RepID=A0A1A8X9G0_PLAMA|nr:PIR Superfamily Protein [Plasmodium malariae]
MFIRNPTFNRITRYLQRKTNSLINEKKKEKFREECKGLAKYLIQNKTTPPYQNKVLWERVLYTWAKSHYEKLNKHGGCPVIMKENDLALLNLKYEVEDFCEEKEARIKGIICFKNGDTDEDICDEVCSSKIKEYNKWINGKNMYFNNKKGPIINKCNTQPSHFPTKQCNILGSSIFKTLSECKIKHVDSQLPSAPEEEKKDAQVESQNTPNNPSNDMVSMQEVKQSSRGEQIQTEQHTIHDQEIRQEQQSQSNLQLTEALSTTEIDTHIQDIPTKQYSNSETLLQPENKGPLPSISVTLQNQDSKVSLEPHSPKITQLTTEISVPSSAPVKYNGPSKILGTINAPYFSIF